MPGHVFGLVGYIGGHAFEDNPLKGLLLGIGIAAVVTLAAELVRHLRTRPGRVLGPTPPGGRALRSDVARPRLKYTANRCTPGP